MKKVAAGLVSLFVVMFMLAGCGGNGPKTNAEKFLNNVYHLDYAAAKEVSTEWTKKQLEAYEQFLTLMPENARAEAKKIKVDIKDTKVTGDTATVSYTVSTEPNSPKQMKMIKQNGKWLAEFSKNPTDNFGGGAAGGTGTDMPLDVPANPAPIDTQLAPPADGVAAPGMDTTIR